MKHKWFTNTVGALVLTMGTAWSHVGTAHAVSFTPPADNAAPTAATGGASRGIFFTPPADNAAPTAATGGASRGGFFTPPADNTAPQTSAGGVSRGLIGDTEGEASVVTTSGTARSNTYGRTEASSVSSVASMIAVVPGSFYGTTLKARPTILVYVPTSNADTAVFSLKNEAKDMVYQMTLAIPPSGGVLAVELPDDAPALAVGENYQWYLAMQLAGELNPGSPFVDGWVKRVEPSDELTLALTQGNVLSAVEALGANGIWYDTAAQLAELQITHGSEVMASHWYELMASVDLADIAAEPIVM